MSRDRYLARTARRKKECDCCAKWKPEVKNTHWTKDCKIWNEDGSRQNHGNGGKRGGVRDHKKHDDAIEKVKALEKKVKDQKKNTRKLIASARRAASGTLLCPLAAAAIPSILMGRAAITKTLVIMILK